MHGKSYQYDQCKLPETPVVDISNAQPRYADSQHLSKISECKEEHDSHKDNESQYIVFCILTNGNIQQNVNNYRENQNKNISVTREKGN